MPDFQLDTIDCAVDTRAERAAAPFALDATQRASYDRDGFLVLPAVATQAEIVRVRGIYDMLFSRKVGWETGDFFETSGDFEDAAPLLPQMNWPSRYEPSLRECSFHRNALAVARELLGPRAELVWEFAIMKPALVGGETPAHQDDSFFTKETDYDHAISIWMPLQDVDRRNGCMEYAAGTHHGPLYPHQSIGGDPRAHRLEAIVRDRPAFTPVPLLAGDAVVHHSRTLHYAGPNTSPVPRRAYILEFAVRSKDQLVVEDYPWNQARQTAREARQRRSMPRLASIIARLRWFKKRIAWSLTRQARLRRKPTS